MVLRVFLDRFRDWRIRAGWKDWTRLALALVFFGYLLFLPVAGGAFSAQTHGRILDVTVLVVIYLVLALGLNIVVGYTGLLDLGYVAFVLIGAYTAALLMKQPWTDFGNSFLLIVLLSGLHCAVWGILRGAPTLHLAGDYYAIVTFAFAEIVFLFALNQGDITGGAFGVKEYLSRHSLLGESLRDTSRAYYYLLFVLFILCMICVHLLQRSRIGRAWLAIKADETSAQTCGVSLRHYKLLAFALSGFIGGVGGALFSVKTIVVSPSNFDFWISIVVLSCLVLGGIGSIRGAVLGTVILVSLGEVLREGFTLTEAPETVAFFRDHLAFLDQKIFEFRATEVLLKIPDQARYLVFGLVMVLIMVLRPQGLAPVSNKGRPLSPSDEIRIRASSPALYRLRPPS
ncbi:MAG: branched-chain amino acid ABC transporter permease [Planctomycetes bacterium]|nr:branched-chain amino acid ABC transporter permease [Planctomycetota bacterium]